MTAVYFVSDCCREFLKVHDSRSLESYCGFGSNEDAEAIKRMLPDFNDAAYVEHDTYWMFDRFMDRMWEWYYVQPEEEDARTKSKSPIVSPSSASPSPLLGARLFEGDDSCRVHLCPAAKRLNTLWNQTLQVR